MELKIPAPRNFSFRRTVASHGWYQLPPFALDTGKWELSRVIDVGQKPPVTISLTERKTHVRVNTSRPLTKPETAIVLRDARHVLRRRSTSSPLTIRSFRGSAHREPDGCCARQPSTKIS